MRNLLGKVQDGRGKTETERHGSTTSATAPDEVLMAAAGSAGPRKIQPYAWYALLVLMLVYVFNLVDRNVPLILIEDIRNDFGISDAQIGFLFGTAFAIFYALFGIPLARLADGWRRARLIGLGLSLWSIMTVTSGLSSNFAQLAAARIGVGIGEASASPAAFSLIADYFPKQRRGLALSIYSAAQYLGSVVAFSLGGAIATYWNGAYAHGASPFGLAGWQAAFLVVGFPGLLLAIWVFTLREPRRGALEDEALPATQRGVWRPFCSEIAAVLPPLTLLNAAQYPGGLKRNLILLAASAAVSTGLALLTGDTLQWSLWGLGSYAVGSWSQRLKQTDPATWRLTWGTPAFAILIIFIGCVAIVDYGVGFWSAPYLLRTFYSHADAPGHFLTSVSARQEVAYFASLSFFGNALGTIFGGWLSDRWRLRDPRGRIAVIGLTVIAYLTLRATSYAINSLPVFFVCGPIIGFISTMYWGPTLAALQDLVLPRMRATAGALALLAATLFGQALGPYSVGKVAMITGSLRIAIFAAFIVVPLMLWSLWQVWSRVELAEATRVERGGVPDLNVAIIY